MVLLDAGDLISEGVLARAFGGRGGAQFVREHVASEQTGQDH
jgi:hypothetical protein